MQFRTSQLVRIKPNHLLYYGFKERGLTEKHVGEIIRDDGCVCGVGMGCYCGACITLNFLPGNIKVSCFPERVYLVSKTV